MRQSLKVKPYKTKKFSSIYLIILLAIFLFVSWAVFNNSSKQRDIQEQAGVLDKQIRELEQQNLELTDLIEYFASSEYVEKEARKKLNLVKPGEKVVVITQSDEDILAKENSLNKIINSKNSPAKWWSYFFGE